MIQNAVTATTNLPVSRPRYIGAGGHALQPAPPWYRASACQADNGTFYTGVGVLLRMAVFFIIILTNEHHVILTCVPLHAQNSSNGEISFFVTRDRIFFSWVAVKSRKKWLWWSCGRHSLFPCSLLFYSRFASSLSHCFGFVVHPYCISDCTSSFLVIRRIVRLILL